MLTHLRLVKHTLHWSLFVYFFSCSSVNASIAASITTPPGKQQLQQMFMDLTPQLEKNPYDAPLYLQSNTHEKSAFGEIYAILPYDYQTLTQELLQPGRWCRAMILHINIKGCVKPRDKNAIRTYLGYKTYQNLEESLVLEYAFQVIQHSHDYTHILLSSDFGPYGTSDYKLHAQIIPLPPEQGTATNRCFIHLSYSVQYGNLAMFVLNSYLATFGRNKVGFSINNDDDKDNGPPKFTGGMRGVVERNAMRYFLALQSYFGTLNLPEEERFKASLNQWFDFTEKYKQQLYEMERGEYLAFKLQEFANQTEMQQRIDHPPAYQSKPAPGIFDF
ncbi:MAG: hypothetical protein OEZ68_03650 [Gammaproteobacteria bacterium]|nr:hypothetical protein [Gammaproteobacteria bacterium]MDH5799879.1 hypothetical protein [Gammaproteobacteria bacterium]